MFLVYLKYAVLKMSQMAFVSYIDVMTKAHPSCLLLLSSHMISGNKIKLTTWKRLSIVLNARNEEVRKVAGIFQLLFLYQPA